MIYSNNYNDKVDCDHNGDGVDNVMIRVVMMIVMMTMIIMVMIFDLKKS
jgi:hypothetical protein